MNNRDDCFVYGFAIFTFKAGAKLKWWVDPAGAMIIASVAIVTWISTVHSEFLELCGLGASPSLVDTVRAYHWGEDLFAEVDIVMAPECSLRETHDVSQELQDKLETVEGFGRAFIHVDYGSRASQNPMTDFEAISTATEDPGNVRHRP
ncbi:hypothetical protein N7462_003740 [Penicillium macrosclerotiorum]|uniref:uncharacterized protein n=1 Tax=Penicillium macrosclerotiorum TaxID=303699 RepID=UPI0025466164|nr:uncharacterized protein N7462_003740 [Penicillium macrosclerotiorum]KAJ5689348.1 hypothetical protein N7462_003740 [Penicillium macrosclerotiorum]